MNKEILIKSEFNISDMIKYLELEKKEIKTLTLTITDNDGTHNLLLTTDCLKLLKGEKI